MFLFFRLRLISLLFVLGLLDCGLCLVKVTCESKIREAVKPTTDTCYFIDFPPSNTNQEIYNIAVDYTEASKIIKVAFVSSPTVKYIPSSIFNTFPNLTTLSMSTNLEELNPDDFVHAINLYELNLNANQLKIIRNTVFSHVARMAQSWAYPADITKISVDRVFPLHKLSILNLGQNAISEIEDNSFFGLNNIWDLQLKENHLKVVRRHTFAGLPSLVFLGLDNNRIETIEDGAFDLPSLEMLKLYQNKLKTLSDVVFDGLRQIQVILLDRNELEHIGRSLYGLSSIDIIFLNENRIQDIDLTAFAQMPELEHLELRQSGFSFAATKLEGDRRWNSSLIKIDLSDNNLINATELINLRVFPKLRSLILDGNVYKNLSFESYQTPERNEMTETPGTPKPNTDHRIIQNFVFTLSKPYIYSIMKLIADFVPGTTSEPKTYRSITDVLPNLNNLSLNGTNIDCTSMVSLAREFKLKHAVEVKHDC